MLQELNRLLGELATTNRYSDTRLINPESVLEHLGCVTMLSMFMTIKLNEHGEQIDELIVMKKAILHDVEEAITGDIIAPTKHANKVLHEQLKAYGAHCAYDLLKNLPGSSITFNLWKASKENQSGLIVAVADKLSVVYKTEQEIMKFGNIHLKEHLSKKIITELIRLKKEASKMFKNELVITDLIDEGVEICQTIFEST